MAFSPSLELEICVFTPLKQSFPNGFSMVEKELPKTEKYPLNTSNVFCEACRGRFPSTSLECAGLHCRGHKGLRRFQGLLACGTATPLESGFLHDTQILAMMTGNLLSPSKMAHRGGRKVSKDPTFTKHLSAMPWSEVDRSANSSIILVLVSPWRLSFSKTESGIRLMLAPRSARAKHSSNSGKSHGIRNLPGSPNFSGNVFRMTAEQFSLNRGFGLILRSMSFVVQKLSDIGANLGMCRRASAKLSSKWRFRKISMNFKAKRSSFSRIFSLLTLDGYGKLIFVLGMTTGSSTWTNRKVGTSLVSPIQ
ncbi:hypothetical protein Tco_0252049 [Tanacetum coccineum]